MMLKTLSLRIKDILTCDKIRLLVTKDILTYDMIKHK